MEHLKSEKDAPPSKGAGVILQVITVAVFLFVGSMIWKLVYSKPPNDAYLSSEKPAPVTIVDKISIPDIDQDINESARELAALICGVEHIQPHFEKGVNVKLKSKVGHDRLGNFGREIYLVGGPVEDKGKMRTWICFILNNGDSEPMTCEGIIIEGRMTQFSKKLLEMYPDAPNVVDIQF